MIIRSPVTGTNNTSFIREINVSDIALLYKKELQFDVLSYFDGLEHIQLWRCDDTSYRFYYPFNIFGDDKFYQYLQTFEKYFDLAKEFGLSYITAEPLKNQWNAIDSLAGAYGIKVAIHDHHRHNP